MSAGIEQRIGTESEPWSELRVNVQRLALRAVAEALLGASDSEPAEAAVDAPTGFVGGVVDLLGEVFERLPDALSVGEVCLVLDRFDVALRGHEGSPSIGAASVLPPAVSAPIVGDASGVGEAPSAPTSDALSEVAS